MACVLADHYLMHRGQMGEGTAWPFKAVTRVRGQAKCPIATAASMRRSRPSPKARSWWSPMTTTARTRATCSSRLRSARRKRWRSSSATRPASSARRSAPNWRAACISIRWWPKTTRRSAPPSPSSVDVRHGLTTGISAEERCNTVRALANDNSGASDFVRPGHVFPLIAREGGVLMRSGHTEACIDLCRLAELPPVGVLSELINDDGTVMRGPQVAAFAAQAQTRAGLDRRTDRLPAEPRQAGRARRPNSRSRPRSARSTAMPM